MSNNDARPADSTPNDSQRTGDGKASTSNQSRTIPALESTRAIDFTPPDRILPISLTPLSPLSHDAPPPSDSLYTTTHDSNRPQTRPRFIFSRRISDQSRLRASSTPSLLSQSRPSSASISTVSLRSSPPSHRRSGDETNADLWHGPRAEQQERGRAIVGRVFAPVESISSRRNSITGETQSTTQTPSRHRSHSAPSLPSASPRQLDTRFRTSSVATSESPPSSFPDATKSLALFLDSPAASSSPSLTPLRLVNHFDRLPHELHVKILAMLITVCEEDLQQEIRAGAWRGVRSSRRWVGVVRGIKELISAGRVSKEWRDLTLDGQIWSTIPTSVVGADLIDPRLLLRIAGSAGRFIRVLDLQGMANLSGEQLTSVVDCCCANGVTSFVEVNLIGCRELDSQSISRLFARSPAIEVARLSGLDTVQTTVIAALAATSTRLRILDVNRCTKLPAFVLFNLPTSISTLRLSRILGLTSTALVQIFHHFPNLSIVDISYCILLDDSAFSHLVACDADHPGPTVRLPGGATKRMFPNLKSLALDGTIGITDRALESLAHAVPSLETMSLARIGAGLHAGAGLVKFFATTPLLRRLDLEDGSALTDAVLAALVHPHSSPPSVLEYLSINRCTTFSDAAIFTLVTSSPKLVALEADSTTITESTAKSIIRIFRERGVPDSILSVLDTRLMRRLSMVPEVAEEIRPRHGRRGYFARHFRYFDPPSDNSSTPAELFECDSARVVVRSFFGSTSVDTAVAARERSAEVRRRRSLMRFIEDTAGGLEDPRASCVVS